MMALGRIRVGFIVLALVAVQGSTARAQQAQTTPPAKQTQPGKPTQPANPPRGQAPATTRPAAPPAARPPAAAPTKTPPVAPGNAKAGTVTQGLPSQAAVPNAPKAAPAGAGAVKQVQHQGPPTLSPAEQAELDRILTNWERESDKVKTLSANFTMWEYDTVFGVPAAKGQAPKEQRLCEGMIYFAAPDKGSYEVTKGGEERWMCDGQSIYEFDFKQKKLKEYRLPKELQGKAITNGPLPFVFGAKADAMKQRYYMRVITPPDVKGQAWIEAWPRWQQDAANFHHVQVILDTTAMIPTAIKLYDPNPQIHKVYGFANLKVNGTWDQIKDFFSRPRAPFGWQHVVEDPPAEALPVDRSAPPPTADARGNRAPTQPPAKPR